VPEPVLDWPGRSEPRRTYTPWVGYGWWVTSPTEEEPSAFVPVARSVHWKTRIAIAAVEVFGISAHARVLAILDKSDPPNTFVPFDGNEFLTYLSRTDWGDQWPNGADIERILREMVRAGILAEMWGTSPAPILRSRYVVMKRVSAAQQAGLLWLTPVLGPDFLVPAIGSITIPITGTDGNGDPHIGSGLLLDDRHILTCAHVVTDMTVDMRLEDPTERAPLSGPVAASGHLRVVRTDAHPDIDVAVVTVDPTASSAKPVSGLVFRDPSWADRVTLFGFPPVPMSTSAPLIVQSGEVVSPAITTLDGAQLFLFSATARPGNSGGPIIADDGRVVGMAVGELTVEAASPSRLPFYGGLPANLILKALNDLGFAAIVTWESWN
jgi:S1-C subfamily serine protease